MKQFKNIVILWILFGSGIIGAKAQSGIVASGGNATGSGGSVSYSVGQVDYIYAKGSGGTMNQGIQQPYELFVVSGMEETATSISAKVFPNPTLDFIILDVKNVGIQGMSYSLIDLQGKTITQQKLSSEQTNISMRELSNGTYFIKLTDNTKELKTFKIIKNK